MPLRVCKSNSRFKLLNNYCKMIRHADLRVLKFVIGWASLLFGLMLLSPTVTFNRPMFSVVKHILPEAAWGVLFTIHGIFALYAVMCCNKSRLFAFLDHVLGSLLWTTMTIGMCFSLIYFNVTQEYSLPAATSPWITLTFCTWWISLRAPRVGE